jgi:hypothetical protein
MNNPPAELLKLLYKLASSTSSYPSPELASFLQTLPPSLHKEASFLLSRNQNKHISIVPIILYLIDANLSESGQRQVKFLIQNISSIDHPASANEIQTLFQPTPPKLYPKKSSSIIANRENSDLSKKANLGSVKIYVSEMPCLPYFANKEILNCSLDGEWMYKVGYIENRRTDEFYIPYQGIELLISCNYGKLELIQERVESFDDFCYVESKKEAAVEGLCFIIQNYRFIVAEVSTAAIEIEYQAENTEYIGSNNGFTELMEKNIEIYRDRFTREWHIKNHRTEKKMFVALHYYDRALSFRQGHSRSVKCEDVAMIIIKDIKLTVSQSSRRNIN